MATGDRAEAGVRREAERTKEKARSGTGWYAVLARVGLVAKGVSYGLVGFLALAVATGHGGKATSRTGALASVADESWGKLVLILLALGFAAYAIWRFVQAVAEREDAVDGETKGMAKKWGKRAGYVGRGLIYAGLTYTTLRLLTGSGAQQSQNQKARQTTAAVFDWPGGRWIVGAAGIAIIGAGLWNLYRGVSAKFEDKWRGGLGQSERIWGRRAGVAGHVARGVVFGLIGIFVTKAATDYDAQDAIGFDGALRKLADAAYGPWLLGLTAVGLVAYGVYCLVDARYRDVSTG